MKLDPDCDVCDDNGMWGDPELVMDVPCPSCNAGPLTDSMIQDVVTDDIDRAKALHPSAPLDIKQFTPDDLKKMADACMEFGKQMLQAALYTTETLENAARQFVEWSELMTETANPISDTNNGENTDD
jgi:hypothetical protein